MEHRLANILLRYRTTPQSLTGVSPAELFLKRQPRKRFHILQPSTEQKVHKQQENQNLRHNVQQTKMRELSAHDHASMRNMRGSEQWVPGTVKMKLGPLTNLVRVGRQLRYVHMDHLLHSKCVVEVEEDVAD